MTAEPAVALVFSTDPWVERLHRFLADHGGGRVRQLVVDPAVLDDEEFDVLVTGDRWPSLTRALVGAQHARRRLVLGVFDPEEPAGKDHLVAVGVDAVVAADAEPSELAAALAELAASRLAPAPSWSSDTPMAHGEPSVTARRPAVLVTGAPGSGATEVALALAVRLTAHESVLLLDARLDGAGTAIRLGLPLEPSLRTAVDELNFGAGAVTACTLTLARSGLHVLTGFPNAASAGQVTAREVLDVVAAAVDGFERVIVLADGEVCEHVAATALVVLVCAPSPLGAARTSSLSAGLPLSPEPRLVVLNRAPRDHFRVGELRAELLALPAVAAVHVVPEDRRVATAAWDGVVVPDGVFTRAVDALAAAVHGGADSRRARRHVRRHARRRVRGQEARS